jgi:hypothetical protein
VEIAGTRRAKQERLPRGMRAIRSFTTHAARVDPQYSESSITCGWVQAWILELKVPV